MEKQLIKKILQYNFFKSVQNKLKKEFFPDMLGGIYSTICTAHLKYEEDLTVDLVRTLFRQDNPALTRTASQKLEILLDQIIHSDDVSDVMAYDLIDKLLMYQTAREIATEAVQVLNGDREDLLLLKALLDDIELSTANLDYTEVEFDLVQLLSDTSPDGLFKFRFDKLAEILPGIGPGDFGIIFARPEIGKTSYACFETAGYLLQGLKVLYCANEEPAFRTYLRILCSTFDKTIQEVSENIPYYTEQFLPYKANLKMIDCFGMNIRAVDVLLKDFEANVCVLDQLDNFKVDGVFARDDLKLGEIYQCARELAKRNSVAVWGVSQCSNDGEGKSKLDYAMLRGSKTDKAGAADVIIGIGANNYMTNQARRFNLCKNKINGRHDHVVGMINNETAMFEA